jgi:uncharacterized repeat protein (TIGR03803 family)
MRKYASSTVSLQNLSTCIVILFMSSVLAAAQHEQILYSFGTQSGDGSFPAGALIADAAGNLYGTTVNGGVGRFGTVFELSPGPHDHWTETVLHSFTAGPDGASPYGSLVLDSKGNLYGTASNGGSPLCVFGCGTVFELSPPAIQGGSWTFTLLYTFTGGSDGAIPPAGLTFDAQGNLYGTTFLGGVGSCAPETAPGCGVVFELSPPAQAGGVWNETVLYAFTGGSDGGLPIAPVVFGVDGNPYGTTEGGGNTECQFNFIRGCGTVFGLSRSSGGTWTEVVLHGFGTAPGHDGVAPGNGALLLDDSGAMAGTTQAGGTYGDGTVYGLRRLPNGQLQYGVLYDFNGKAGDQPVAGVILVNGMLYGTSPEGGPPGSAGTAFQLARTQGVAWKVTGLYRFKSGGSDGAHPQAGLLYYNGAFYGTTSQGGGTAEAGTVFAIVRWGSP